jgi:Lamin Tail Domain
VYQSIAPAAAGGDGSGILSTAGGDENPQLGIDIASAGFVYQGSPVTAMSIHPNGYIALNNAYSTYASAFSWDNSLGVLNNGFAGSTFDGNKRNIIAPFYEDLDKASPVIYYKTAGTKVIVEWFRTSPYGFNGPQLYFQAVLDASDQSITFNYGNMQLYTGNQTARYSYTSGISGGFISPAAQAGQIMQQQYENTTFFTHDNGSTPSWGANGLSISPEPHSSVKFTPGTYVPVAPPAATPPVNDNPAGAILRPALASFPNNIAWDNGTNTANLYTTRFATNTASPAICAGASNAKDVWFKFIAPGASATVRIYGSAGFIPRLSLYDSLLVALPNCVAGTGIQSLTATTTATGLTVGKTYFVRVHHDYTGTQATATATITNGVVTGLTVVPGSNYSIPTGSSSSTPVNQGPRISFTGGGGAGAAAACTNFTTTSPVQPFTASNISFTGGSGYTSPPTVTIESPDWGITGEFGIIVYAAPVNDECSGAIELTNLSNTGCITGQNSAAGSTQGATASPEPAACGYPDDDLWYKFTATETTTYIKMGGAGSFYISYEVLDGGISPGSCASKTPVTCISTQQGTSISSSSIATIIGNTYFVRVYHYDIGASIGDSFNICVAAARPPCITAPASPANGANRCKGTALLSWQPAFNASTYDLYLDAGAGPATTLVYTGSDTGFITSSLVPGIYTWRVVPKNLIGAAIGCSNFSFTVNAPPTVSLSPAGQVIVCAPATQFLSVGATNAASPGYQWMNGTNNIDGATGPEIVVASTGSYRLVITDGITGCRDTSAATVVSVFNPPPVAILPVAATISCDTAKLSVAGGNAPIKITEITLFRSGTGQTVSYPAYMGTADGDFIEISNVSTAPVNVGGYTLADYGSNSATAVHPYTIPAGTIIPANGVMVIQLGTGTNDPANLYFNTGGSTGSLSSVSQIGFVIKDASGNVADAVGCGGALSSYIFAPATGVAAVDWSGFAPNVSGFAGLIRSLAVDNNKGSDWVRSGTPTPLQTIGTYNGGYTLPVYTWSPATGLFVDAALTIPYTNQNTTTVYARPAGTTTYNVQATGVNCPGNNAVTVTVLPPATIEWTGTVNTDWMNTGNWKCGGIPTITSNVIINGGAPNYPLVTLNVEVKSLNVKPGAVVNIATGFEIKLNGN